MIWTTDKMVSLLEKTEISDVLHEAFEISGNSFSYKDNITLKTVAYSESQEFLSTVRSCPLHETAKRYKVRQITENSVVRGYLIVDKTTGLSEDGRNLTETVLLAIKLLLRQTITKKTHEARITSNLFSELISGKITNQESLSSRLRLLSIKFPWNMVVLSADIQYATKNEEIYIEELLTNKVNNFYPDSYIYHDGNLFSCILALKRIPSPKTLEKDILMIADQVNAEISRKETLRNNATYWGCGKVYSSLLLLKKSYYEASQSVLYAKIYSNKKSNIIFWTDTGAFRLIGRCAASQDAIDFHNEILSPFLEHEYLIETLGGLDANNWNLANTAATLTCHYNTIKYRYKKIRDILAENGYDIENHETRFDIAIALRLYKIYIERGFPNEKK
ncbi:CdaR family transcriptional regulator [Cloacibacillus porcorum]|uniref:PucR family transcriptional regulator n=1 Tax=Cloacibacillus porcorum TaxID=1197717 RepID=UPI0023F2B205|nr:PucR family transcriptional regulator [Cloacibacillus porcorum]MDD7648362.1 helix-turn-helix domain-containing protein [Cloacibacillus porcorum]MDY4092363.1 helix-turn-helix domain-containing protein [Cloacibacillus porcorum]